MVNELGLGSSGEAVQSYHESCSIAAMATRGNGGVYGQDGVFAAIFGLPRWQHPAWVQTAAERGAPMVLWQAWRDAGVDCLQQLGGRFVLAVVDTNRQQTLLAVDRLGLESLFYTVSGGQLIFSSNARALLRHPDVHCAIDSQALFDYLYFHMVPSPRCIFSGVEKLLPGQYLLCENRNIRKDFYWAASYKEKTGLSQQELATDFLRILDESVSRSADRDNTGTFLSGGTDSSTVAGTLRKLKGKPIDTYCIGFDAEGFDETYYARIAASHFATNPHEYYLTPKDVADAIPLIAKAYDEPFGNASAVPAYFCARMARADGMDVLLAGDGGDELFGGNERYAKQKVFEIYQQIPKALRYGLIEPAIFNFPLGDKIKPVAKAQSYIKQANIPLPDRLETYNFLQRTALPDIFADDFLAQINRNEPIELLRETYHRARADSSLNRILFLDLKFTLADNDLRKVNRMGELAGIEVRYPLLDEEMVGFSAQLPASLKVRGFKLRYFFKQALRDFLPAEILAKPKHGFGLPFGLWMNSDDSLRELTENSLSALSRRGIIKPEFILKLQQNHREYPSYYGVMIWVLMMLEQWLQTLEP